MKIPLGKVEYAFALAVVCYVIAVLIPGTSGLETTLQLTVLMVGLWVFARIWRASVREILWRLRNRLIVAYLLIGLVPVILITALVGLGGYLVLGQVAVHLIESQLERAAGSLHTAISLLAQSGRDASAELRRNIPVALDEAFPGLEIVETDGKSQHVWPEGSRLAPPPRRRGNTSGVLLKDGLLYGWAHATNGNHSVTALFPLSRDFLGDLAPNLGQSIIVDSQNRRNLHPAAPGRRITYNRVPPAVNQADIEIEGIAPVEITTWDGSPPDINPFMTVRTRVSAVLRTVFTENVDFAGIIPFLFFGTGLLFLLAEIAALVVAISMTRNITGAVHDLYEGTLQVRTGDFTHRIPTHGRDQLAELGGSFNEMTANLERLVQVEKDRQRIQSDLEIAREVQNQLYPRDVPEVPLLRVKAARSPARVVSGDYYDFQRLAGGELAVAIGDVAGKGISAALLMATIQSSIRMEMRAFLEASAAAPGSSAGTRHSISTSAMVSQLNKHLYEFTAAEKYATFLFAVYEPATSMLTYTNAGHLPPMLVRGGVCSRFEVNGTVVGAFPFVTYEESRLQLEPGDLLVLFTDGITEPENAYGEMYGEERLADLVCRNAQRDEDEIVREIMHSVRQWTGSDELQDDMTLVLLRRR